MASFVKLPKLQRQRAGQLSVEIDWAAAHPGDDAGLLHFVAEQPDQNDVQLRAHGVVQDTDHFEIDLFDLIALENRIGDALHAGLYIS